MNILLWILLIIASTPLVLGALLPEILASLAGAKRDRRIIGLKMIKYRIHTKDVSPRLVDFLKLIGFFFLGLTIGGVIDMDFLRITIGICSASCLFRIANNWAIHNSLVLNPTQP